MPWKNRKRTFDDEQLEQAVIEVCQELARRGCWPALRLVQDRVIADARRICAMRRKVLQSGEVDLTGLKSRQGGKRKKPTYGDIARQKAAVTGRIGGDL